MALRTRWRETLPVFPSIERLYGLPTGFCLNRRVAWRTKNMLPTQVIEATQKRITGMNPICQQDHREAFGDITIKRRQQLACIICPGCIDSILQKTEWNAKPVGCQTNLKETILTAMRRLVHGQIQGATPIYRG